MSEHRKPNLPSTDHAAHQPGDDAEGQNAGGANLGGASATQESASREDTIAELKQEFPSFQPAVIPRDVEDNDAEWQRTGGAPVK